MTGTNEQQKGNQEFRRHLKSMAHDKKDVSTFQKPLLVEEYTQKHTTITYTHYLHSHSLN